MQQSGGKFANGAAVSAFAAIQDLNPMWGEVAGVLAEVAIPGYGLYSCAEGGDCNWSDWSLAGLDAAGNVAKWLTGIGAVATVAVVGYRLYKLRKATKEIPSKATDALAHIKRTGNAPPGHKGGRVFKNDSRRGGQQLPQKDASGNPITYKEYDVNPYQKGVNRGTERLVLGSDGKSYYTSDHYKTVIPVE